MNTHHFKMEDKAIKEHNQLMEN